MRRLTVKRRCAVQVECGSQYACKPTETEPNYHNRGSGHPDGDGDDCSAVAVGATEVRNGLGRAYRSRDAAGRDRRVRVSVRADRAEGLPAFFRADRPQLDPGTLE